MTARTFGRLTASFFILAAWLSLLGSRPAAAQDCDGCARAEFWQIDPKFWTATQPDLNSFPERAAGMLPQSADLGIAFSGGGTRSASATIGQLRGLRQNGWLSRVGYATAVSGGSWAAVPFTYYQGELDDLLGTFVPTEHLDPTATALTPAGALATQVAHSGLAAGGVEEVPSFLPDRINARDITALRTVLVGIRDGIRKLRGRDLPDSARQNKAYAHLLGEIFIDPLVKDGNRRPYTWTRDAAVRVSAVSRQPATEFTQVVGQRPFLIVGGTAVWIHPAFRYPRLIPVEYTPLYTGIRQQFGDFGGTYVMPWAYDRAATVLPPDPDEQRDQRSYCATCMSVDRADRRMFTLADVIGSSGAAPQLTLLLDKGVPEKVRPLLRSAVTAFPAFTPVAVRKRESALQSVAAVGELAHGDGGFTDNLGLMPLLAREVHHIIVFVNSDKRWNENDQLQSYFFPLDVQNGSGDKSMNAVFQPDEYKTLLDGLDAATKDGGPAVFCQSLRVKENELYNIAKYDGLKVCWVYNHAAAEWKMALPVPLRELFNPENDAAPAASLRRFPYFSTFGENKPSVITLTPLQVNLLADLSCWAVTNDESVARIVAAFGESIVSKPHSSRHP